MGNTEAVTLVLGQAGLRTGGYRWTHDANAKTGDYFHSGVLRVPSQWWFASLLSVVGVTHFVWGKEDGSEINVTAPAQARSTTRAHTD